MWWWCRRRCRVRRIRRSNRDASGDGRSQDDGIAAEGNKIWFQPLHGFQLPTVRTFSSYKTKLHVLIHSPVRGPVTRCSCDQHRGRVGGLDQALVGDDATRKVNVLLY